MQYEKIFRPKQHYITIPQRESKRLAFDENHIQKFLKHQKPHEDLYITKYPLDSIVTCIILDFDSEDNRKAAYKDAKRLRNFTKRKGLNTVIVDSSNKGYHTYTQINYTKFQSDNKVFMDAEHSEYYFKGFVEKLIDYHKKQYKTLDKTNTGAGLKGNIRLIDSLHPKTGKRVEIIDGEFIHHEEMDKITNWEFECIKSARYYALNHVEYKEEKVEKLRKQARKKAMIKYGVDPVEANDLRKLMPELYGGKTRDFGEYITMTCPFHNDNNPSMKVTKNWYYCWTCNEKGNWWTLREKGAVDFKDETIKVGQI